MYLSTELLEHVLAGPAKRHAAVLATAAKRFDIRTPNTLACWLGHMHVESAGFTATVENLNYRADRLINLFGRHRISVEDANKYGSIPGRQKADPKGIASCLYGGDWGRKNLGNLYADDAWRFIGRGFKQVTGRYNYTVTSDRMFGDERLLVHPEMLEQPEYAAMSAGEFWDWKDLNKWASVMDHQRITKLITGGNGEAVQQTQRERQSNTYLARIKTGPGKPDFSRVISGSSSVPAVTDEE